MNTAQTPSLSKHLAVGQDGEFHAERRALRSAFIGQQFQAINLGREREEAFLNLLDANRQKQSQFLTQADERWSTAVMDCVQRAAATECTLTGNLNQLGQRLDVELCDTLNICRAMASRWVKECDQATSILQDDRDGGTSTDIVTRTHEISIEVWAFLHKCVTLTDYIKFNILKASVKMAQVQGWTYHETHI